MTPAKHPNAQDHRYQRADRHRPKRYPRPWKFHQAGMKDVGNPKQEQGGQQPED
jgi:hypothetical protein